MKKHDDDIIIMFLHVFLGIAYSIRPTSLNQNQQFISKIPILAVLKWLCWGFLKPPSTSSAWFLKRLTKVSMVCLSSAFNFIDVLYLQGSWYGDQGCLLERRNVPYFFTILCELLEDWKKFSFTLLLSNLQSWKKIGSINVVGFSN